MERDKVFDATKYLLVILVIIGHFIEPTKYENSLTQHIFCCIYSFHMPLFVFMSGYFYRIRSIKEEIQKSIPLLETCLLSHFAFYLLKNGENISIYNIVDFGNDPSWYLLSLFYWRICSDIFLCHFNKKNILIISIIVDSITFVTMQHGGCFSIERTIAFYPMFLLGYSMNGKIDFLIQKYAKQGIALGIISFLFIIFSSSVLQFQIEFQRAGLFELLRFGNLSAKQVFVFRYAILLCALFISFFILCVIAKITIIQKLSMFGSNTLFIYFAQTFLFAKIGTSHISLTQSLITAFFSILALTFLSKYKQTKYVMSPIWCFFERKRSQDYQS